jgi:LPS sulfotransferase NodH
MAHEIGMVHPQEEDGADDLADIDFGAWEWHEASTGIAVVERALSTLRSDPSSVSRHLYEPALKQDDVIADLESMLSILVDARDREVRFRLHAEGQRGLWPRPS